MEYRTIVKVCENAFHRHGMESVEAAIRGIEKDMGGRNVLVTELEREYEYHRWMIEADIPEQED